MPSYTSARVPTTESLSRSMDVQPKQLLMHNRAVRHGCSMDGLINASSAHQRLLRLARTSMITRDAATTRHLNGSLDISRVWHGHVVRGTSSRVVDRVYESRDVRRELRGELLT